MFGFSVYLTIVYGQKYWKLRQIWWLLCCPTSLLKLLDNGSTCSMYLYLRYWQSIFSIFRVWTSLSICSPSKPKYHKYDSFFLLSIQTVTMDVIQKIFIVVFLVTTNLYWIYCKYIVQKKNQHKPNEIFDRSSQWRNEHNHCCMLQIGTKIYCNKNLRNKNLLILKNQH